MEYFDWKWKEQFPVVCDLIQKGDLQVVWKARFYGGFEEMEKFILVYEKGGESRNSWILTAIRTTPEGFKLMPKIESVREKK